MKNSQFNTFLPYKGNVLGYNAFTDQYLLMQPFLYELFQAALREKDVAGLNEIHPGLVEGLSARGFLVPEEKNELEAAREASQAVDENDRSFHLIVNPTMNCNFSCWYCYESHIKGSKMGPETLEKLKSFIRTTLDDNPQLESFILSWFGGEPLLYFRQVIQPLSEFVAEECRQRNIRLESAYTTNGFLVKEDMLSLFRAYRTKHFQITLDGHREQHNQVRQVSAKRGSYDEILANIKLLVRNQFPVTLRFNYTPDKLGDMDAIADDLADLAPEARQYLKISLHKVWQSGDSDPAELHRLFDRLRAKRFSLSTSFNRSPALTNSCYADRRMHATVNYNGDLFKCTARDFRRDKREGDIEEGGQGKWNITHEKRMNAKFKNKPCLSCRILPLCNGGCSQLMLENEGKDYCVYDGDEHKKDEVVLNRFLYQAQ